jgi:hypothetical protein
MKKIQKQKKLQLTKIKVASLTKTREEKGLRICVTSLAETSCSTCSRAETLCDCI